MQNDRRLRKKAIWKWNPCQIDTMGDSLNFANVLRYINGRCDHCIWVVTVHHLTSKQRVDDRGCMQISNDATEAIDASDFWVGGCGNIEKMHVYHVWQLQVCQYRSTDFDSFVRLFSISFCTGTHADLAEGRGGSQQSQDEKCSNSGVIMWIRYVRPQITCVLHFCSEKGTSCNPSFRVRREMPETQMLKQKRHADAASSKERQTSPEVKLRTITRRRCTRSKPMRHWYVEPSRHLAFSSFSHRIEAGKPRLQGQEQQVQGGWQNMVATILTILLQPDWFQLCPLLGLFFGGLNRTRIPMFIDDWRWLEYYFVILPRSQFLWVWWAPLQHLQGTASICI